MNNSEIEAGATRSSGQNGRPWDAQNSLKRNAGLDKNGASDEVTPLLGNGNTGSPESPEDEDEWEGANDFVGQPWTKRPSVSNISSAEVSN